MSDHRHKGLRALELFRSCRKRELSVVERLGTPVRASRARVLTTRSTDSQQFFVVCGGRVTVWFDDGSTSVVEAGSWFGCGRPAPVRLAVALDEAALLVFARHELLDLIAGCSSVARRLEGHWACAMTRRFAGSPLEPVQ